MRTLFLACLTALCLITSPAQAHEVRPAIGDLTTGGGMVTIVLRLFVEPVLAGVDLEGLSDTNDTESAAAVDAYRALSVADLQSEVRTEIDRILAPIVVETPQGPVTLSMDRVETDAEPNLDLPRETRMTLTGPLPRGAETVTVTWPASYGVLVLRQIDSEEGYTGYLIGGTSEPIPVSQGGFALPQIPAFGIVGLVLLALGAVTLAGVGGFAERSRLVRPVAALGALVGAVLLLLGLTL